MHIDVDLSKVRTIYHQRDLEEGHKDSEMLPTVNPRDWAKTLEKVEEYIRGFCRVDWQRLRFGLKGDLINPVASNDPTYCDNESE